MSNERNLPDPVEVDSISRPGLDEVAQRLDRLWPPPATNSARFPSETAEHQVGRYTLDCLIGRGAFGIIYKAYDAQLNREVAVKLPRQEVLLDADKRQRFETEAKAAAALIHPAIVQVYEAQLDGPIPYIASQYVHGPDLRQWLAERIAPVTIGEAVRCVARLADAVEHAHQHGVLHRDLKPGNVLLAPSDHTSGTFDSLDECQPRLTDFGLAKLADSSLADTRSSVLLGTPLYMAPEQLHMEAADAGPATDVYALGVLLFELLTLTTPFDGGSYIDVVDKLRSNPAPRLRELNPSVPGDLETICACCLEKYPGDRYQTAGELAEDLRRLEQGQQICAQPIGRWERIQRWCEMPQRIRQAGIFSLAYNFLTIVWITFSFATMAWLSLVPVGVGGSVARDAFFGICFILLPKAWIAWQTKNTKRWAIWLGTAVAVVHLVTVTASGLGFWPFFEVIYRSDPAVRWLAHGYLIVGSVIEVILYAIVVFGRPSSAIGYENARS